MTTRSAESHFEELATRLDALIERAANRSAARAPENGASFGAAWRGGTTGAVKRADGTVDERLTAKLHGELAFWIEDAGERGSDRRREFETRWSFYQRQRLGELAWSLGLDDAAAFKRWMQSRSMVEVGGGPFPCVSMLDARSLVAADPLADAYVAFGLVPARAARVVHLGAAAEQLPLSGASTDLVICENCLDHVEDPVLAMGEMSRLLVPGGLLWLLVDLMEYRDALHPNPMSVGRLAGILKAAGLEMLYQGTWDGASHPEAKQQTRVLAWKPGGERPIVRGEPGRIADSALIGA